MQSLSHLLSNSEQEICEEAWPLLLLQFANTVHGTGRRLTEKEMTSTLNPGGKKWLAVEAKTKTCAQWSNLRILFLTKTISSRSSNILLLLQTLFIS